MSQPAPSLWAATAAAAPETPPLEGSHRADVAIVGAGFTGLAAALRLAGGGASVIVAEAETPGFGASGRNGGQVIPGLKHDPDTLDALFGEATTEFAGCTADVVFELVDRHAIDCGLARKGWIQPAVRRSRLPELERRMREWRARGAPVEMLDAAAMAHRTGTDRFVGGWIDHRAGSLHPLDYVRGLLRAALAAGARVHGASRVVRLEKGEAGWIVATAGGARISAAQVIIATNGYSDGLWPGLKATVIPAGSFQVATAPLGAALLERILPERNTVSDNRRVGNYFRIAPGGRLMMGGRGNFSDTTAPGDYRGIEAALHAIFPDLAGVPIEFRWTGRIAMTRDHLPHVHQPFANLTIALGYNGRGVALATALGTAIADHLLDRRRPLPLKLTDIRPLPLHGLHPFYASAMVHYYRLRDALDR